MSEQENNKTETKQEEKKEEQAQPKTPQEIFPLKTILGQKVGMTRIFLESGENVPVSVIYTADCTTTNVRTQDKDGYNAVQLGVGQKNEKQINQPIANHFKKLNITPLKWLKEFRVQDATKFQVGVKVPEDIFNVGDYVDVSGITKGRGFAGAIKRHGFHGLPHSHGASVKERSRGSSGGGSGEPQRVLKGTRMAGRMGSAWVTSQSLEVVKVDKENGLILVKGSVPGVNQNIVIIKETSRGLKHKAAPPAPAKAAKKAAPKKGGGAKPAKGK